MPEKTLSKEDREYLIQTLKESDRPLTAEELAEKLRERHAS